MEWVPDGLRVAGGRSEWGGLAILVCALCAGLGFTPRTAGASADATPVAAEPASSLSSSQQRTPAEPSGPGPSRSTLTGTNAAGGALGRSMESLDDKQRLAVGDRVTFRVVEDQEEARALTVTDTGELNVPELGLVEAAGKCCRELAFEIKAKLEQTTYYRATVILGVDLLNRTPSGRKVYVVGQVRLTGPQEIPAGEIMTVSRAIMKAGGFTDFADRKRIRLVRAGAAGHPGESFMVNVSEVLEKGRTENDLSVEPEDLIYVPTRSVNFF